MAVFAMSDLHLALGADKPMDVFGEGWRDYMTRIRYNWNAIVAPSDVVIIGGDVSWAMYLDDCGPDFEYLNSLSGVKIISKGNHDYWWESVTKLRRYAADNGFNALNFLHNNSYIVQDWAVCGTRGWIIPSSETFSADDMRMYERELNRLELSAQDMALCAEKSGAQALRRIAVLHYPPVLSDGNPDKGFAQIMKRYGITLCIYGHLHGIAARNAFCGIADGIEYRLVSADFLKFEPYNLSTPNK